MPSEALFTVAHPDCEHPEYWSAPDADATEDEVSRLIGALIEATKPRLVVETGTYLGTTTRVIRQAVARNVLAGGPKCRVVTLEVNERLAGAARKSLPGVEVICCDSLSWLPPGPIDFLFCDSGMTIRGDEIRRFAPWLHRDSIVAVHDCRYRPVFDAMGELVAEGIVFPWFVLPTPRMVGFTRVATTRERTDIRGA